MCRGDRNPRRRRADSPRRIAPAPAAVLLLVLALCGSIAGPAWSQVPDAQDEPFDAVPSRLRLPEKPTEAEVFEYVVCVLQHASRRHRFTPYDPEVLLLARVGPDRLDLLLDFLAYDTSLLRYPLTQAVARVATSRHKARIIDLLRVQPDLIGVVLDRGWADDAHEALVALLTDEYRAEDVGATELLHRCAELRDPRLAPLLLRRLTTAAAPAEIIGALTGMPGLDLAGAVRAAWSAALADEAASPLWKWKRLRLAEVALGYGDARALEYLVQDLAVKDIQGGEPFIARTWEDELQYRKVVRHTGVTETGWRLLAWWEANRECAVWDKTEKRFVPRPGQTWAAVPVATAGMAQARTRPGADAAARPADPAAAGHAALMSVTVSAHPTAAAAREYVGRVLEITEQCGLWREPAYNPQARLLARVGSDNTDVLLDAAENTGDPVLGGHLLAAAGLIALEKHRDRVIALLPRHTQAAAAVVMDRDWIAAARPVVPELLTGVPAILGDVSAGAVQLAARCADLALYPALFEGLMSSLSPRVVYESLRGLPGIEPALGAAVGAAWDAAAAQRDGLDISRRVDLAVLALSYGRLSALEFLSHWLACETPDPNQFSEWWLRELAHAIIRHTDAIGTVPELRRWYEANRQDLKWDVTEKRFRSRRQAPPFAEDTATVDLAGPPPLPRSLRELVQLQVPAPATDAELSRYVEAVLRVKYNFKATDNAVEWDLDSTTRKVLIAKVGAERMDILLELLGRDWDERRAGNAAAALALGNGTGNALELKALADAFHGGAVAVGRAVTPVARLLPLGGSAPALGTASDPTVTPDAEFDAQATLRAPGETLVPVIERLATAADRPRILAALEHRPDLIWVVLTHGWEREARPLVTRRLGNHPAEATEAVYLNPGWLEAAVRLRDPQTFEDLKWWLIYGWGKANTYALLRRVPDLNLNAPTVTAAWRRVVAEAGGLAQALEIPNRDEAPRFAALAARRGNRDALGFLFRVLRGWRGQDNVNAEELRFALVRLTQARGADADMLRWYSTNRGRLVFDRTTRQFSVRAGD